MAVEARQTRSIFHPPQVLSTNRGTMMNSVEGIGNVYTSPIGYRMITPPSTRMETEVPMIGSAVMESVSRKRSRDAFCPPFASVADGIRRPIVNNRCSSLSFLGEDFSLQFLQQQQEIDRFIAQHESMRIETEKNYSRRIAAVVEENITKKLRSKDEEINKMEKLNFALEERVKSLTVENQIWREVAESNEATANALRCNLEQVLARVEDEQQQEEAQSCCASTTLNEGKRMCRKCGELESCVLLLPCRHLCLCTVCGSSLHTCPVCNSIKTASVHVNLSPS